VRAEAKVETVIPQLLERDEPIGVVDESGAYLGVIDRQAVADMLQAEQR
jgi:predicted transcriptional regulator